MSIIFEIKKIIRSVFKGATTFDQQNGHYFRGYSLVKLSLYLEYNNIGDKGCETLSLADWPYLSIIYLRSNKIGVEGVEHLAKANWPLLKSISLGTIDILRPKSNRK
jgi:hypothetical protein